MVRRLQRLPSVAYLPTMIPVSASSDLANLPLSFICDGDADAQSYIMLLTTDWPVIPHCKFERRLRVNQTDHQLHNW